MRKVLLIPILLFAFGACDRVASNPAAPSEVAPSALLDDALAVTVDIQPFSTANVINLGTRSYVSVAVLGSAVFDVTSVDPATAMFGPGLAVPAHVFTMDSPTDHIRDINEDGFLDVMFHFDKTAAGLYDLPPGEWSFLELTALTVDGTAVAGGEEVKLITNGSSK